MARRFISGTGQLLLAISGFVLVCAWFAVTMYDAYTFAEGNGPVKSHSWMGVGGAVVFAVAWIWSLFTSLAVLRQAKVEGPDGLDIPPRITNPPPGL